MLPIKKRMYVTHTLHIEIIVVFERLKKHNLKGELK
mgnify:CR=1 FL=1